MSRIYVFYIAIYFLLFPLVLTGQETPFFNHSQKHPITIIYDLADEKTVELAAEALARDIELLSGISPAIAHSYEQSGSTAIIVGSIDGSNLIKQLSNEKAVNYNHIAGQWETYTIRSLENPIAKIKKAIVIMGSDKRGTAYGIFHLSEVLGVSPWYWWADVVPEQLSELSIPAIDSTSTPPSVKYRGIFLNDECWGLNPWASKTFEPEEGNIGPRTYAAIFELLLRLRGNFIWPAMHPCTNAFYSNPENPQTAQDYGIVVGSSHAEPMLRNNVDEWHHDQHGDFNFFTNRETVLNYWEERVEESVGNESIYTLGMRGIHDSGMVGAGSMEERVDALEDIIGQQRLLLSRHINPDPSKVPQAFTTYKEVLDVYDAGMEIDDDITLVWPDDNYGYIHRFSSSKEEKRTGGSGIYYHLSYWGRPHDYLWLSSTHPVLIWEEMAKAYYFNSRDIWVANVGDIKPLEYNLSLFMDMAWNMDNFATSSEVREHMKQWYSKIFGPTAGQSIADIQWKYHQLNFERRPEFMGWSQTEPTRKTHFTEYNHFEAGDEAQKRINRFDTLMSRTEELKHKIPKRLSDAYFQLVEYPVKGAGLINKKFLYQEKAYHYAKQNRIIANELALRSKAAYDSILLLTDYYNLQLVEGKWKNMMNMQPRNLPVFDMPAIPQWQFNSDDHWGLGVEGDEEIRRVQAIKGPMYLPSFNSNTQQTYFVDLFLKQKAPLNWTAIPSESWITIDQTSGTLTGEPGSQQQRLYISIDWDNAPKDNRLRGSIRFSGGNKDYTIQVYANQQAIDHSSEESLFVEDRGYIAINAENFSRQNNTSSFGWDLLEGLGYSGSSAWVNPLKIKEKQLDPELKNPSTLEYDFITDRGGEITVTVYALPVHPINQDYSNRIGIGVNDEEPQIVDHKTYGRSEEWKQNVLRNSAQIQTRHRLSAGGQHTLKIYAIDPGIIIDRIIIDKGGAIKTYSAQKETVIKQ